MSRWGVMSRQTGERSTRWTLLMTPLGALSIERTTGPDPGPHHHPCTFVSLVITGGYLEARPAGDDAPPVVRAYTVGEVNVLRRKQRHQILSTLTEAVWTITVTGPRPEGVT